MSAGLQASEPIDNFDNTPLFPVNRLSYQRIYPESDANEEVPSYETSQWLHEQQRDQDNIVGSNSSTVAQNGSSSSGSNSLPYVSQRSSFSSTSSPSLPRKSEQGKRSLKQLGLKSLNANQHFALACCRDISLLPCLMGLWQSWIRVFSDASAEDLSAISKNLSSHSVTAARVSEHFLTGVWCIVSAYLSHSVLDGLIVRWMVNYLTPAAILRTLSMSVIMVASEQYLLATFSAEGYKYGLHIWILISCCLTLAYIIQNFVTSNLDLKGKKKTRFFDMYNIVVFAVVPVGLASFITMIGLLRSLLILRLDVENDFNKYGPSV